MKKIIILFALAFFGVSITSVAQARQAQNTKIEKFKNNKKHLSKRERQLLRKERKAHKQSLRMARADGKVTPEERKLLKRNRMNMKRKINRKKVRMSKNNRKQLRGQNSRDYRGDLDRRQ